MLRLRRLFKKEEISWAALVLEVFSVTLSVLVAMAIGDWHQERQKQKAVEQALRGIEAELASNQRQLEDRLPYYQSVAAALRHRVATEGPTAPSFPLKEWNGIRPAMTTNSSYQVAIATQAFSNLDFQTATTVAQIYSFQDLYRSVGEKFLDRMIEGGLDEAALLEQMVAEHAQVTSMLIRDYEAVREGIRKKLGEPMPVPPSQVSAKP